jgi:hypothetical protein
MTKTISAPVDAATSAEAARREPATALAGCVTAYDEARDRVMVAVRAMQRTAAARGLTGRELERLLADARDLP